jgi:hypothetical protein
MTTEARVDSYPLSRDAERAKAFLESQDISVRLEGNVIDRVAFTAGPILTETSLFVEDKDRAKAEGLLDQYHESIQRKKHLLNEPIDHQVTRACMAAYLGFVTIPFVIHAYSAYLLLSLNREEISTKKRYLYSLAWLGNLTAFGLLILWFVLRWVSS